MVIMVHHEVGMNDLLVALRLCHSYNGYQWIARYLGFNRYLVISPKGWREQVLQTRIIVFGDF
jgi:hypothetical protein